MESNEEIAAAVQLPYYLLKKRSECIKPWLGRRINLSLYETLVDKVEYILGSITKYDEILRFIWIAFKLDIVKFVCIRSNFDESDKI